jgi:hypothetical protein
LYHMFVTHTQQFPRCAGGRRVRERSTQDDKGRSQGTRRRRT